MLLPCNVTGIPPPVVTWYKDEIEIQSRSNFLSQFQLQGNNLVINNVTEDDAGYFKCRAQNYLNYTEQLVFLKVTGMNPYLRILKLICNTFFLCFCLSVANIRNSTNVSPLRFTTACWLWTRFVFFIHRRAAGHISLSSLQW